MRGKLSEERQKTPPKGLPLILPFQGLFNLTKVYNRQQLWKVIYMIKTLHKLRRKKGFTLVELIAVLAIIAVLAMILVPTLLGAVESARIVSVNHAATNILRCINNFFVQADADDYGMKLNRLEELEILVSSDDGDTV